MQKATVAVGMKNCICKVLSAVVNLKVLGKKDKWLYWIQLVIFGEVFYWWMAGMSGSQDAELFVILQIVFLSSFWSIEFPASVRQQSSQ